MENTSGQGKTAVIPEGISRWSWGASTFGWIWGLFNGTYSALLCLIPYVGFVVSIVLGIKGNEWAWRNKKWESVEQFHAVQKKWAVAAAIFMAILLVGIVIGVMWLVKTQMAAGEILD